MDANGDGILDPSEVPEERRRFLGFMANRLGIDTSKPVALSDVRQSIERRQSSRERPSESEQNSGAKSEKEQEPLVPGFGVDAVLPRVPEFGERVESSLTGTSEESRGGTDGRSRGRRGRSSSDSNSNEDVEERVRRFVPGIMRRYDTNGSGALEKDEWGQMRTDPSPSDANHDGVITMEELTAGMVQRFGGNRPGSSGGNGSSESESANGNGRKSYRLRTAHELLPEGLPGWFTEKDANLDGQVAMAEYSRTWSEYEVRRFQRYDLNGDGIITPAECKDALASADWGEESSSLSRPPGPLSSTSPGSPPSRRPPPSSGSSGGSGGGGSLLDLLN